MHAQQQTMRRTTSGNLIDPARWDQRKREAAELIRRGYLTAREAAEQFALPIEEIATAH
jgi:hypothetical protein